MSVFVDLAFMDRVMRIRYGSKVGTAFYVEIDGYRMLLTAAHVVEGLVENERIAIRFNSDWKFVEVRAVSRCSVGSDVCAILPNTHWGEGLPEDCLEGTISVGQDVVYCGFPLDLEMNGLPGSQGWPTCFVKSAMLSGIEQDGEKNNFLFDTLNNKGFSGGPIIKREKGELSVVAIVSGYKYDKQMPVYKRHADEKIEELSDFFTFPNSGFMVGIPIGRALKAAKQLIHAL